MKRRFNVTLETIRKDLDRTAKKLGYSGVQLLKSKSGSEGAVKLLGSKPKTLKCSTFNCHDDNWRAIGLTLEYQRRIREEYGAEMVRQTAGVVIPEARQLTSSSLRFGS